MSNIIKHEPRKTRGGAVPDETIAKALKATEGRIYHAADQLGVSGGMIFARIKESPYLQEIKDECLQKRIDSMEKGLQELVTEKNLGAICFGLKTLGRSRGYVENPQPTFGAEIAQGLDAVLKQMAEIQNVRRIADMSLIQE